MPLEWSKKASLGWWDLKRGEATEDDALLADGGGNLDGDKEINENWWPGSGRWRIGLMMENATIEFPEGKRWAAPGE